MVVAAPRHPLPPEQLRGILSRIPPAPQRGLGCHRPLALRRPQPPLQRAELRFLAAARPDLGGQIRGLLGQRPAPRKLLPAQPRCRAAEVLTTKDTQSTKGFSTIPLAVSLYPL